MLSFGADPDNLPDSINTLVHETCHAYEGGVYSYNYYISADEQITVTVTDVFPSMEIEYSFPDHLKTFRYDIYIYPSDPIQSTQINGVYGLPFMLRIIV